MQGISVYTRPGRPTFYVAYDCPLKARRVCESTGIKLDDPRGKLAAYAYAREKSASGVMHGQARDVSQWGNWVEAWLRMRFANQPKTLTSYLGAWKFLSAFLHEKKIPTPRALTYQDAIDFVLAREGQVKKRSGRKVSRNTALHNVKVLSRIMREAVRRGYAPANPCFRLSEDVPRTKAPEKPEFTDEQVAMVRTELKRRSARGPARPEWMAIAFEIALLQNCRLSATQIPMDRIDLKANTILFHEKGGKVFTVPIHPDLRPLLARLKAERRTVTCELPLLASRSFSRVLRRLGLPHTFHSTRVTGITRFARAGIPEQQAMAYVGHGGWAVHRIYQRLKPADVRGCHAALSFGVPAVPGPTPGSPQSQGENPATPTAFPASSSARRKSNPPAPALRATG
jgi:integrase